MQFTSVGCAFWDNWLASALDREAYLGFLVPAGIGNAGAVVGLEMENSVWSVVIAVGCNFKEVGCQGLGVESYLLFLVLTGSRKVCHIVGWKIKHRV